MGSLHVKIIGALAAASLLFTGCATTGGAGRVDGGGNVAYGDAKAVETVTADFGSTDLQSTAEMMTQSLLESRYIAKAQQPPKIRLRDVANKTEPNCVLSPILRVVAMMLTTKAANSSYLLCSSMSAKSP